jgi:hypothetical protein
VGEKFLILWIGTTRQLFGSVEFILAILCKFYLA